MSYDPLPTVYALNLARGGVRRAQPQFQKNVEALGASYAKLKGWL